MLAAVCLPMLEGCGGAARMESAAHERTVPAVSRRALSPNDSRRLKYFYFEAVRQQAGEHYDAAFDLLQHCLAVDPCAAEVYFTQAAYYSTLGNDSAALQKMRVAAELEPDNDIYLERLAEANINMQRFDDAISTYERLYDNNRERSDVLDMLLRLYAQNKDYDAMIRTINRIENVEGRSEQTALSRMRVYSLQGKKKEELGELRNLARKYPGDMNYRVMTGNWLLQNGREKDALKEFEYVLEQEPDNHQAQMSMMDYYRAVGQDSLAGDMQEKMLLGGATPTDVKMLLMRKVVADNEQAGGDSTQVLELFRRILAVPQRTSDMTELCAAYMSLKKMPQDTVMAVLADALRIAPDNAGMRLQMIQVLLSKNDVDGIIELCRPALEYNPDEMVFYYFLGLGYNEKKDYDNALETLKRGISQINESSDKTMVSDFYALMGDVLHRKGRAEEAFAACDSSLQWKDDNIGCLNNYAYYLSLEGRDLQKAEQMSYRTVKAEPDNSTYLDTYAWILFMQKRYEEARIYIDLAVRNDSTASGVILEHAGDIHAVAGDMEKAVEYWQKAADNGGGSALLPRKIKQRTYIKE